MRMCEWFIARNLLLTGGPWSSRWAGPEGGEKGVGQMSPGRFAARAKPLRVEVEPLRMEPQKTDRRTTVVDHRRKDLLPALGVGHPGNGIAPLDQSLVCVE